MSAVLIMKGQWLIFIKSVLNDLQACLEVFDTRPFTSTSYIPLQETDSQALKLWATVRYRQQ